MRRLPGKLLRARLIETEAYLGPDDLASHASKGRTRRTGILFGPPGHAYVYLIYGLHEMLNVVAGAAGQGRGVLIRAADPLDDWKAVLLRTRPAHPTVQITRLQNGLDVTDIAALVEKLRSTGRAIDEKDRHRLPLQWKHAPPLRGRRWEEERASHDLERSLISRIARELAGGPSRPFEMLQRAVLLQFTLLKGTHPPEFRIVSPSAGCLHREARILANLATHYSQTRRFTEHLCEPLAVEDFVVQSMPDASPTRWHLAHTAWFFETFVLARWEASYRPANVAFQVLFNSYYNGVGEAFPALGRGLLTRPTVAEVFEYRHAVDERMARLLHEASTVRRRLAGNGKRGRIGDQP